MMLTAAGVAHGQQPIPLISVDVDLSDFGIDGPEGVVRGRVSIAYAPDGPRLGVYYLRHTPPPRRTPVAIPDPPPDTMPADATVAGEQFTALWVWNTADLLTDGAERIAFLDFIEEQEITRVFLYLPAAEGESPSAGFIPFDGRGLGYFELDIPAA